MSMSENNVLKQTLIDNALKLNYNYNNYRIKNINARTNVDFLYFIENVYINNFLLRYMYFDLTYEPLLHSENIFFNGKILYPNYDYIINKKRITFLNTVEIVKTDDLKVSYLKKSDYNQLLLYYNVYIAGDQQIIVNTFESSLMVYKNRTQLVHDTDYTINENKEIVFQPHSDIQISDIISLSYFKNYKLNTTTTFIIKNVTLTNIDINKRFIDIEDHIVNDSETISCGNVVFTKYHDYIIGNSKIKFLSPMISLINMDDVLTINYLKVEKENELCCKHYFVISDDIADVNKYSIKFGNLLTWYIINQSYFNSMSEIIKYFGDSNKIVFKIYTNLNVFKNGVLLIYADDYKITLDKKLLFLSGINNKADDIYTIKYHDETYDINDYTHKTFTITNGLVNNKIITLQYVIATNSEFIFMNGLMLNNGHDYTIADSNVITFVNELQLVANDIMDIYYVKSVGCTDTFYTQSFLIDSENKDETTFDMDFSSSMVSTEINLKNIKIYQNGYPIYQNKDYTVDENIITFSDTLEINYQDKFLLKYYIGIIYDSLMTIYRLKFLEKGYEEITDPTFIHGFNQDYGKLDPMKTLYFYKNQELYIVNF